MSTTQGMYNYVFELVKQVRLTCTVPSMAHPHTALTKSVEEHAVLLGLFLELAPLLGIPHIRSATTHCIPVQEQTPTIVTFSLIPRPSVQSGNLPGLILNPLSCNFLGCKLEMYRREFRYKHIASVSQTCKHWCSHKYFLRKGYLLPVYTSHTPTDISFCWHTYLPGQHPID